MLQYTKFYQNPMIVSLRYGDLIFKMAAVGGKAVAMRKS